MVAIHVVEEEAGEPVEREDGAGTTMRRAMKSRRNAGGGEMVVVGGEEAGEKERMRREGVGEVVAGMFESAAAVE